MRGKVQIKPDLEWQTMMAERDAKRKADNAMSSMCYAVGAAAKLMREAGYSKAQMLEMMECAWEIMLK